MKKNPILINVDDPFGCTSSEASEILSRLYETYHPGDVSGDLKPLKVLRSWVQARVEYDKLRIKHQATDIGLAADGERLFALEAEMKHDLEVLMCAYYRAVYDEEAEGTLGDGWPQRDADGRYVPIEVPDDAT